MSSSLHETVRRLVLERGSVGAARALLDYVDSLEDPDSELFVEERGQQRMNSDETTVSVGIQSSGQNE